MSEDTERLKRRLEFLKKEHAMKAAEMKSEASLAKLGAIGAIFGGNSGDTIRQQQHLHRVQDLSAEIRRLKFEIEELEAELEKKEELPESKQSKETGENCPSCNKDVSWLPANATNCPYCGAKLERLFEE